MEPDPLAGRQPGRRRRSRVRPAARALGDALRAVAWTAVLAAAGPAVAAAPRNAAPTIPLDEIHRGQRGYGLSVFAGTQPERFEVEVLGVLRNLNPDSSYVLARLSGQGLEESGVVSGMSGSPVYLDGRLAGAVAFAWPFSREAVAGITPIAEMRRLAEAPAVPPPTPGAVAPVALRDLAAVRLPGDLLADGLRRLRPALAGGAAAPLAWAAAGFGAETGAILRRSLGAVGLGGTTPGGGDPDAGPGAGEPLAAVLVDGDLRLAAVGTVTDRSEDEILAFGHAFFGYGPVRIPMARAEVITVISALNESFKVSNLGPVIGAIDQDRRAGLRGRLGLEAPTIPLVVRVEGEASREFSMRLADMPQITPALIATSVLGSLEAASYRSGLQGLDLRASFLLEGHEPLVLDQSFDGASAGVESAGYMMALAGFLLQNELAAVRLKGVAVELRQEPSPRTATLVGAHAERTVVRPGDPLRLNVDLVAYRGSPFRRSLELRVPEDLPAGRYSLLVGDGPSVDVARLAVEAATPVTFDQALRMLRSFHSRRELVVLGVFAGQGLAVAGQPMPRLPGSVRSLWGAAPSGGAVPLKLAVAQQRSERLDSPLSGIVRVDLEVRHREPRVPDGDRPGEGEGEGGSAEMDRGEPSGAEEPRAVGPSGDGGEEGS